MLKMSNKYQNFKLLNTFDKFMYIKKNANHNFAILSILYGTREALFYINEIHCSQAQIYVIDQ